MGSPLKTLYGQSVENKIVVLRYIQRRSRNGKSH